MPKKSQETLGQRIRRLRQDKGLTQGQLGTPRLTEAYISMIEAGKRNLSQSALEHIAGKLGVEPDELATGRPAGLKVELELALEQARRDLDGGDTSAANAAVKKVLREATSLGFLDTLARAHEIAGLVADRSEGAAAALAHYERALEQWKTLPLHLRAETVAAIAWCTHRLGEPRLAVHMLETYRQDLEATGTQDPTALMRTYSALVDPYFGCGLPEKAAEAARQAIQLETRVDNPDQIACMHLSVARTLYHEARFDDALASLRKAQDIYLAGGWRNRAVKAQLNEAIVLAKKENYEDARSALKGALAILAESPNRADEVLGHNEMGFVLRHLGELQGAMEHLQQARDLLQDDDVIERAFNERELGLCAAGSDDKVAERHLLSALDLYRIAGDATEVATTCKALGELYMSQGRTEEAFQAMRDGISAVEERSA